MQVRSPSGPAHPVVQKRPIGTSRPQLLMATLPAHPKEGVSINAGSFNCYLIIVYAFFRTMCNRVQEKFLARLLSPVPTNIYYYLFLVREI